MLKRIVHLLILPLSLMLVSCDNGTVDPEPEVLPKMNVSSATFFEGDVNKEITFSITISETHDKEVRVTYTTQEITAGEEMDFVAATGTAVIPAGEREAKVNIEIVADTLKEQDEEFKLVLSDPVQAELVISEGIGTIRNDDSFVFIPADGYITPTNYVGYDRVWADEFDEPGAVNSANWTHELGASGWGNEELQYYTDRTDNSYVEDGRLVIEAKKESFDGAPYTSARLISANKQTFAFGRVDIRAILPEGQGIWPALWMLGTNIGTVGWPACGEIDIMELVGHEPGTVHGTAHWGPQGQGFSNFKGASKSLLGGEKFSEEYHVFSIEWESNSITWFMDDEPYFNLTPSTVNGAYPFNAPFFFIFNIAVGGRWPGYPDGTTQFPQKMYVDYIRVFQKK
ncbi:MAG: family 16 glycosylhydrolase [Bacteroidota bacterium]